MTLVGSAFGMFGSHAHTSDTTIMARLRFMTRPLPCWEKNPGRVLSGTEPRLHELPRRLIAVFRGDEIEVGDLRAHVLLHPLDQRRLDLPRPLARDPEVGADL